ncbi:protein kinase domain-containing protein [Vibrio chaetopteri]|uniref:protein kinase domain-containing protein n=1 Tax=Vibrio chaetopteri TaxID=3016528 RepID=UPI003AB4E9D2
MENSSTLPLGHRIKEYSLEGILGQGGFGIVYRGIHTQLREEVVIKELLPSELAGRNGSQVVAFGASKAQIFDDCMGRFVEEGRTLRKLQHKNIVSCRDLFTANGTAYLVMDYEDGMPLDSLTRQIEQQDKQYTEEELLHFLIPLAEGIAYIHSKGVLHRDIKPANVYIRRSDGSPVLLDFGSAKQNYAETTQSKAPFTEFYAPLEQIEGGGEAKASIDIYAFGGLMYRLITGGVGPKAETRAMAIVYGKPDPLGETKPWNVQISKELCLLVDKCLSFKPSDRPATMLDVIEVLKRIKSADINYHEHQPNNKRKIDYKKFDRIRRDVRLALVKSGRVESQDRARIYLKAASFGFHKSDIEEYISSEEKIYFEQKGSVELRKEKVDDKDVDDKSVILPSNSKRKFEVFSKGREVVVVDSADKYRRAFVNKLYSNGYKCFDSVVAKSEDEALYKVKVKQKIKVDSTNEQKAPNHKHEKSSIRRRIGVKNQDSCSESYESDKDSGLAKKSLNIFYLFIFIFFVYGLWAYKPGDRGYEPDNKVTKVQRYQIEFRVYPKISSVEVYNQTTKKSFSVGHGSSWLVKGDYKITVSARGYDSEVRYLNVYSDNLFVLSLNKKVEVKPKKNKHAESDIKAVKWFRKSADQGNAKAQYNLASMYEQGRGVDKDMTEAVRWYVKSAKQGNKDAQSKLKTMGKSWN